MSLFDIVIPVGPNDANVIHSQIEYTKKNIIGYRNIYLVSKAPLEIEGCIDILEDSFPITIDTIVKYHGQSERNGWYLQQLIKLYASRGIPEILETYLVIDTDTFFLKPTTFIDNDVCLYAFSTECHWAYFHHMARLHPEFKKVESRSGICHHMIFQKKYIDEMFSLVETHHGVPFYEAFLKQVAPGDLHKSGASEYELYFNYMLNKHPTKIQIRTLVWQNVSKLTNNGKNDYESVHYYIRSND